jgi:type III secretion system YscQ/HrcQ family protein
MTAMNDLRQNAPRALHPLRGRLSAIDATAAAQLRQLFGAARTLRLRLAQEELCLRLGSPTTRPLEFVELSSVDGALVLGLYGDRFRDAIGEREWWDYEDAARTLAWTLAHESLLAGLAQLFGTPLLPQTFRQADAPLKAPPGGAVLGFGLSAGDGRGAQGQMALPAALLQRLAEHDGWQTGASANILGWAGLPVQARLSLQGPCMALSDLRAIASGDLIALGPGATQWSALLLRLCGADVSERCWRALWDGQRLVVSGVGTPQESYLEHAMNQTENAAQPAPIDELNVALDLDLGAIRLSLGELAALQPGYVFEWPVRLDDARVVLRANGQAIGRGELVAVGEVLGVQVLELNPPAKPA